MKRSARRKTIVTLCSVLLTLLFSFPLHILADYDYTYSIDQITAYAFWSAYGYDMYTPQTYASDQSGISFSGTITDNVNFEPRVYRNSDGAYLGTFSNAAGSTIYYSGGNCNNSACHIEYRGVTSDGISFTVPANSLSLTFSSETYLPFISASTFNRYSSYTYTNRFVASPDTTYEVIFFCNKWINTSPVIYCSDGTTFYASRRAVNEVGNVDSQYHMYLYQIEVRLPSGTPQQFVTMDLDMNNTFKVIPIFTGWMNYMPSDVYLQVFGREKEMLVSNPTANQIIENGNSSSQSSVSGNDTQNQALTQSVTDLTTQEDAFNNQMQQNLNNINFQGSDQFLQTGLLSTSAHWVKTQYNRMVNGNVFGSLVSYALLFGLGILIVGKMR